MMAPATAPAAALEPEGKETILHINADQIVWDK
jgi:hypothetical protein